MKPEYIGIGNYDENNYVYAYCKCPLSVAYAIKWPRIKDGKPHRYTCICENCGTEVGVVSKSYGPELMDILSESEDCISRKDLREPRFIIAANDYQSGWNDALDSVYKNAPSVQPKM